MVCTKQVYNLTAGWTGATLMSTLETAHVDAGLAVGSCTDRFTNGSYHHLVHRTQFSADVYGSDYTWWMFDGATFFYSRAVNGWNSATDQPLGAQYLDHLGTAGNSSGGFCSLGALSTGTSLVITRYTSGIDASFSAFVIRQGATQLCWFYTSTTSARQSWLDLNKRSLHSVFFPFFYTNGAYSMVQFGHNLMLRRDIHSGSALKNYNQQFVYKYWFTTHYRYAFWGKQSTTTNNWWQDSTTNFANAPGVNLLPQGSFIVLPIEDSVNNPAFASLYSPVFSGLAYNPYLTAGMPADFGAVGMFTNAMTQGDGLIITAGTDEWEVITHRNNSSSGDYVSPAFCAKII